MPAASSKAYLSGLLIGGELHDVLRGPTASKSMNTFKLIGSPELAQHYRAAAAQLGLAFEPLDAKAAFVAAMARIQSNDNTHENRATTTPPNPPHAADRDPAWPWSQRTPWRLGRRC